MNLYEVVQCPYCGVEYATFSEYNEYPKIHTVCSTCFMPIEIDNPFYNDLPEKEK